jgi:hypothetical protein
MSDLPYNNNPNDECFYCSHIYTFHSSSSLDNNIQKGSSIESKKKDLHNDIPTNRYSFVNNFDKSSCKCPGFRSSLSSSSITN